MKRDKDRHYIMIKGSIQDEDITIIYLSTYLSIYLSIYLYAPNIGAPQYVRQMLSNLKGEINSNTIILGVFNTLLTPMDRTTKQKIARKHKL